MRHHRTSLMQLAAIAVVLAIAPATRANLIINGGFEEPVGGGFFPGGSSGLTGWTIAVDNVETVSDGVWPAYEGELSLDLDGGAPGSILQSFATVAGQSYTFGFAYANNYANPAASAVVTIIGSAMLVNEQITHGTSTPLDADWTLFSRTFIADAATTTLSFTSDGTLPGYGIALDAVSVTSASTAVPEPSSVVMLGLGAIGVIGATIRRRSSE